MTPDQIAQILDDLGRRLGPAGEYVFRIAVQRVVISSFMTIAVGVVVIVAVGLLIRGTVGSYRAWQGKEHGPYSSDWAMDGIGFPLLIGCLVGCIAAGLAFVFIAGAVVNLLTPEYAALRDILQAIGGSR